MSDRENEKEVFEILEDHFQLTDEFVHNPGNRPGDQGKPDFVVDFNGEKLGIEITEINIPQETYEEPLKENNANDRRSENPAYRMYGKPLREHEVAKQRIVDRAREKAQASGLPPLRVAVHFAGNIPKGREKSLTTALFEMVRSHCPERGHRIELDELYGLPDEFWLIRIHNYANPVDWWNYIEPGGVETEFSDHLQQIIDDKSAKVPQYLKHCNTCWLIIVALGDRPSSFYLPGSQVTTTQYQSAFERVFFMNKAHRIITELQVEKGAT